MVLVNYIKLIANDKNIVDDCDNLFFVCSICLDKILAWLQT
ncbi:hypothetical protein HMPREF0201_01723 [Cedecea davisae DSM 4568]|uniref:Uncharacterized protein n=1 Tax=Cedecea davisae DSM 4568 TaxID=566551 RepID=S3IVJ5_9ENTR|nr:hypothetical protein HMPREF0201_01723 [Cedecea davisae DSM 4568]